jgi:transcriptional regulator
MYLPAHFSETRLEVLQPFMQVNAFATLVTLNAGALNANHLPFEYHAEPGPFGILRAHVARNNPVLKDLAEGVDALVIFQGEHGYVSPSLYPSKAETHKVVPTYNYMVAHATGPLRIVDDASWLRDFVTRLTDRFEAPRTAPWAVADAPADYIDTMLKAIVGIEIPLVTLVGKWKVSENRAGADKDGVISGMQAEGKAGWAEALLQRHGT